MHSSRMHTNCGSGHLGGGWAVPLGKHSHLRQTPPFQADSPLSGRHLSVRQIPPLGRQSPGQTTPLDRHPLADTVSHPLYTTTLHTPPMCSCENITFPHTSYAVKVCKRFSYNKHVEHVHVGIPARGFPGFNLS